MSDVSWESSEDISEDIEAPTDDVVEQHQTLPGEPEPGSLPEFELPDEADEADAAEQHIEVGDDEDENYR